MKFQTIGLALSQLALLAKAATWKFNVVNLMDPSYSIGLKYDNRVIKMNSVAFPVFTTSINSGSKTTYKYVILDKNGRVVEEESIERSYSAEVANINEVYNRETKDVNIEYLPQVYDHLFNDDGTETNKNYDDSQIYTVYANCKDDDYKSIKYAPLKGDEKNEGTSDCTVTFVTKTDVYQTTGKLQLIGFSSRKYKKLSWKIKINDPIFGRKTIKFRANANDPTMMRDKISSELFRAVGVPTYSSAYARLMINNDIYGLYNLVDSINDKWIASFIHGDDNAHVGTNYKTYAGADLKYLGETDSLYSSYGGYELDKLDETDTEANGKKYYRLAKFTKLFSEWNKKYGNDQSQAAVNALEQFFELESLLRQMAIESLTFAHDNFWANSNNFIIYYNPELDKYQIIPHDFDGTFYGSQGDERFSSKYTTDVNDCINWANHSREDGDTYFFNALLKHNIIKNRYNEIMRDTVYTLFNVNGVSPLIDSISSLIQTDVAWNFGLIDKLDSSIPGFVNHYTLQNFQDNTNYGKVDYQKNVNTDDAEFGIKQWIQLRGNQCQNYVKNLGLSAITTTRRITTTTTSKRTTTTNIIPTSNSEECWSLVEGYPCCTDKNTEVLYVSQTRGVKYGVENGDWCGIIEDSVIATTTASNAVPTNNSEECWSLAEGYPCCTNKYTPVLYVGSDGSKYGVENNDWCGIIENTDDDCWSLAEGYPCCTDPNIGVAYVETNGAKYGYENNNWCGIIENNITTTTTTTTTRRTTTTRKTTTTRRNTTTKRTTTTRRTTTTKNSTNTIPVSSVEDRCGPQYGRCKYEDDCCSSFGHCGTGNDFCGVGCQKGYGLCY